VIGWKGMAGLARAPARAGGSALSSCRAVWAGWVGAAHRFIHGSLRTVTQRSPTWAAHVGHATSRCLRVGRVVMGIGGLLASSRLCAMSDEAAREIVTMKVTLVDTSMSRTLRVSLAR
jgi:hypothetical protein